MEAAGGEVTIRPCRAEECKEVMRMIRELASFEKLSEQVKNSDEGLWQDGFKGDPFYHCIVAEVPPESQSKEGHVLVGYGLYFFTYSTWKGRNIYMEDLYVMPEFRGRGIGKRLMSAIAKIGLQNGCTQMKFTALDWNQPAIDFYISNGAEDLTAKVGWHIFCFEDDAMRKLASGESSK